MSPRSRIVSNFALRLAYGAGMLVWPVRIAAAWTGQPADRPVSEIPMRGIGGREIALHGAGIAAILGGAPALPWLLASLGGDLTDITTTFRSRRDLPPGGLRNCLLTGGGSALLTIALIQGSGQSG